MAKRRAVLAKRRVGYRQDPHHLMLLKTGGDRGGRARTWEEVATLVGVSAGYARRVAQGNLAKAPPRVWLDPRTIIPDLAERLDDDDVEAWNRDPYCLCGCGGLVQQEIGHQQRVPYGAYRLFKSVHEKRMPWAVNRLVAQNAEQARRDAISAAHRANSISAGIVTELLQEWRAQPGNISYAMFARISHVSRANINDIAAGNCQRVRKLTAAKIFAALGEPMRPEIYQVFRAWAKPKGIAYRHLQVEGRAGRDYIDPEPGWEEDEQECEEVAGVP